MRRPEDEAPLDPARLRRGIERVQAQPDGDWLVRNVPAGEKVYRCPGCDHEIPPGTGHVVVWPAGERRLTGPAQVPAHDDRGDLTGRRHWHTACWAARDRRRPT